MRLAEGIVVEKGQTFGMLKFPVLRREARIQNEDGSTSEETKERTYDLKSKGQGRTIQASVPTSVPLKGLDHNTEVELINPVANIVATATFRGVDVDWHVEANGLILKGQTKPHQKCKEGTSESEK